MVFDVNRGLRIAPYALINRFATWNIYAVAQVSGHCRWMPNGFANIFHRKGGVDCTVVFLKSSVDECGGGVNFIMVEFFCGGSKELEFVT